jgi:threonine/homoserine/homoserine lactone efflux protein
MNGQQSVTSRQNHSEFWATHPRQVAGIRVGVGILLLVVMSFLLILSHGNPWALLLAAGAALHFYLAYRGLRNAGNGASRQ